MATIELPAIAGFPVHVTTARNCLREPTGPYVLRIRAVAGDVYFEQEYVTSMEVEAARIDIVALTTRGLWLKLARRIYDQETRSEG